MVCMVLWMLEVRWSRPASKIRDMEKAAEEIPAESDHSWYLEATKI
jgi:hypothetical protein